MGLICLRVLPTTSGLRFHTRLSNKSRLFSLFSAQLTARFSSAMALDASFISFSSSFIHSLTTKKPNPMLPMLTSKGTHVPKSIPHLSATSTAISAIVSERAELIKLTFLEGNSWLWDVNGVNILVDPILVGNLDFGIPWLYDAAKKVLKSFRLEDLPELDCLLITQSLDDHCHLKTLEPLSKMVPELRVISTPNAESKLNPLFRNVTYLEPSQSTELDGQNCAKVVITATAGPVLGPPWQRLENGYMITCKQSQFTLYYEPHCVYNHSFMQKYKADVIITPVIKQLLPGFTLVSGQEDTVNLVKLLQAKFVVPMKNGDLDSKGILSSVINSEGTVESFKELLRREVPNASVLEPKPGEQLEISMSSAQ